MKRREFLSITGMALAAAGREQASPFKKALTEEATVALRTMTANI